MVEGVIKQSVDVRGLLEAGLRESDILIIAVANGDPCIGPRGIAKLLNVQAQAVSKRMKSLEKFGYIRPSEFRAAMYSKEVAACNNGHSGQQKDERILWPKQ
ncbi:MAG: winged helix-turn-helix domain-containing protein [Candidatus Aenigmatarchaeota archaeon]|nr:MAG: winged helix-turn-helix domain-containing protein [Candidatus Aenigmarchaeota archaeon]